MTNLLHNLYLFDGLSESDLELIENITEVRSYNAGEHIFRQEEPADSFYIIQYGSVSIDQIDEDSKKFEVATYGTGSHFGEMPLLDDEPRSANATAVSNCDLIRIGYASMIELLDANPQIAIHFYRELSKFLCSRLRLTTIDLGHSRSKNLGHF